VINKHTYKVVVVEDEPLILEYTIQKIETANPYFKVVGSAYDGRTALSVIDSTNPDILFTDIRMPIMDGLELIRETGTKYPEMRIVIFSGYNDFEYAQKAIKYGVKEYLLKPISMDHLKDILKRFQTELEIRTDFQGLSSLNAVINGFHETCPPPFFNECLFNLYLICIGNKIDNISSGSVKVQYDGYWNNIQFEAIAKLAAENVDGWWVINTKTVNEKFFIVAKKSRWNVVTVSVADHIKSIVSEWVKPFPVTVCTNLSTAAYTEILAFSQNLKTMLNSHLVPWQSSLLVQGKPGNHQVQNYILNNATVNKILTYVQNNNRSLLKKELYELLKEWESLSVSQKFIEKMLQQLLNIFHRNTLNLSDEEILCLESEIYEKLSISKDSDTFFEDFWQKIECIINFERDNDSSIEVIESIASYIKANFTEPLNLNSIANKFNISPAHLTRTFKRYKGDTPLHYIINLRIEEAKKLIKSKPELDLKDISEIVGYDDQHYFSKTFKKVTGVSPSEYKEHYCEYSTQTPLSGEL